MIRFFFRSDFVDFLSSSSRFIFPPIFPSGAIFFRARIALFSRRLTFSFFSGAVWVF